MSYQIRFEDRQWYVYVYVRGQESLETSLSYLTEAVQEAHRAGRDRLLIEEDLQGQLTDTEMYELASRFLKLGMGRLKRIAFVDRHDHHARGNELGELVARNRGVNARIFSGIDSAEKWLSEGEGGCKLI